MKQGKSSRVIIMSVSIIVSLMFLGICFGAVKLFLSDDGSKRKRQISMITLVKPPPPKIKEKPPEPEIKKEEIIETQMEEPEPEAINDEMAEDDIASGDDLGLDAFCHRFADGQLHQVQGGGSADSLQGGDISAAGEGGVSRTRRGAGACHAVLHALGPGDFHQHYGDPAHVPCLYCGPWRATRK